MVLLQDLGICLLQIFSGVFFICDLSSGSSFVTDKQSDYYRRNNEHRRSEKCHVVTQQVDCSVVIELVGISECEVLRIIGACQTDASVKES